MSQSQTRVMTGSMPDVPPACGMAGRAGAFRQRPDFTLSWMDPALEALTGISFKPAGISPEGFWKLIHEEDRVWLKKHLDVQCKTEDWLTTSFRIRNGLTGQVCHILEWRRLLGSDGKASQCFEGLWYDQTPLRRAERRLAAAASQEILGRLTAGYVHDLNNVLAGLGSLTELSLMEPTDPQALQQNLVLIKESVQRAVQVSEGLSRLLYPVSPRRGYHDLNHLGREALHLVRPAVARWVSLEGQWADLPLPIYVEGSEFRQVLFHLVLNAASALAGPGQIILGTSRQETFQPGMILAGKPPKQPSACLSIMDTGQGMDLAWGQRIFDVYFSTRVGKDGVGLGLALARQFALEHAGAITVESKPGHGCVVRIWLPVADLIDEPVAPGMAGPERGPLLLAGPDGPFLRGVVAGLEKAGQTVVWARQEPLLVLASAEEAFAAVLVCPDQEIGPAQSLVEEIRRQKVPLKVILMDGQKQMGGIEPFLEQVDLILEPEEDPEAILERILAFLERPSGGEGKGPNEPGT